MTRRDFSTGLVMALGAATVAAPTFAEKEKTMKEIALEKLSYAEDALAPVISAQTIAFHYGKHHAGYVKTLNGLIAGTKYAELPLVEIVRLSAKEQAAAIFNNAAQIWNHTFYWESLAPVGKGGAPSAKLLKAVDAAFGSLDVCRKALADAAVKRFGSGWAWLVANQGKLSVISTPNAETPVCDPATVPLAVVDVWEHAYYLDWQNRRADYAKALVDQLIDWNRVSARFE